MLVIIPKLVTLIITDIHSLKYALQQLCVFVALPHTSEDLRNLRLGTQLVLGADSWTTNQLRCAFSMWNRTYFLDNHHTQKTWKEISV